MFEIILWFFSCSCQLFIVLFNFHFRSHEIHHIRYWVHISIIIVFRHLLIHKYEQCLVETKVIKRESFLMILLLIDDPNQTLQKSRMRQWNFCLRQLLLLPLHGLVTTYTYKKKVFKKLFQQCQKDSSAKKNDHCYARSNECHASRVCAPILINIFIFNWSVFIENGYTKHFLMFNVVNKMILKSYHLSIVDCYVMMYKVA